MLDILDRTFGIEFEFADVEKDKVVLPDGFSWNKEETFRNTDCSPVSGTSKFGGEINTPPLRLCSNDINALKFMFGEVIANGAKCTYVTSIHVHIGIADLELEDLIGDIKADMKTSELVVVANQDDTEDMLLGLIKEISKKYKVKSSNISFGKILELAKKQLEYESINQENC